MATKKRKPTAKPVEKKEEVKVEETTEVVEVPFTCSFVGKKVDTRSGYVGVVTKQRWVPSLNMLLVYFENGFCVNSQICKVLED